MGIVRMGPPSELIINLSKSFQLKNFVETGTFNGGTARWATEHFEKVITIEYAENLYQQAVKNLGNIPNLELIFGDSRTELTNLIARLDSPSIFWLDAHWSGGSTYGSQDECPLLNEIAIINRSPIDHYIIIDDARLFLTPPLPPHKVDAWPPINQVIDMLLSDHPNRYMVIIEDVIIAVPNSAKHIIIDYCYQVLSKQSADNAQQLKMSDLEKGTQLIWRYLKSKLRFLRPIKNLLFPIKNN